MTAHLGVPHRPSAHLIDSSTEGGPPLATILVVPAEEIRAHLARALEKRAATFTIEVDPAAEDEWTSMVDRGAGRSPSFGQASYYFGTNIPGKPRKYLLNSAGRPKLFVEMAKVVDSDYKAFRLSRSSRPD